MTEKVKNETSLRKQMEVLQKELWGIRIQPMNNTDKNMLEKEPQSGIYLFSFYYSI